MQLKVILLSIHLQISNYFELENSCHLVFKFLLLSNQQPTTGFNRPYLLLGGQIVTGLVISSIHPVMKCL